MDKNLTTLSSCLKMSRYTCCTSRRSLPRKCSSKPVSSMDMPASTASIHLCRSSSHRSNTPRHLARLSESRSTSKPQTSCICGVKSSSCNILPKSLLQTPPNTSPGAPPKAPRSAAAAASTAERTRQSTVSSGTVPSSRASVIASNKMGSKPSTNARPVEKTLDKSVAQPRTAPCKRPRNSSKWLHTTAIVLRNAASEKVSGRMMRWW
mmetsp:Transcript_84338/g.243822  ORF Transcript_84338/g.243822 Transcript_84338/m.243822 type:complete len:208 (-) Transcript_84338:478-1101(-)